MEIRAYLERSQSKGPKDKELLLDLLKRFLGNLRRGRRVVVVPSGLVEKRAADLVACENEAERSAIRRRRY